MQPPPWYLAGPLLGLLVLGVHATFNAPLGATGAFVAVEGAVRGRGAGWRTWMFAGVIIGGFVSALAQGAFDPSFAYGSFDARFGASLPLKAGILLGAGMLIGFGARTAGGCTSGHGVCGSAALSPASLVSTMTFMGVAVAVANLVLR